MHIKKFLTVKVLQNYLPSDLILAVWSHVETLYANFIFERILFLYYTKFIINARILMELAYYCMDNNIFYNRVEIEKFFIFAKNNISYDCIRSGNCWINRLFVIYHMNISPLINKYSYHIIRNIIERYLLLN